MRGRASFVLQEVFQGAAQGRGYRVARKVKGTGTREQGMPPGAPGRGNAAYAWLPRPRGPSLSAAPPLLFPPPPGACLRDAS
jgi:hypothetical protein